MKRIIDLPIDHIWPIIFSYLSIQDLFNCRLVNKLFKYFSDHTNGINKLIIGEPNYEHDDYYWYYNYKSIEDKDIISLKCFRTIQKLSIFNLDKYLKYLKIYNERLQSEEISNQINLEIIEFGDEYDTNQQIINLNNLKVFISNYRCVQLNTPKLEKIQLNDMNQIKLNSNPESIKHLITINYDNKLEIFKNLEILELGNTNQTVNEDLLIIFKNLKKLKIKLFNLDKIQNCLIKILNDKIRLEREIDIYLEDVKIENIDKFYELVSSGYPYWKFRINNYDLLDLNVSSINYLRYAELEECINNMENNIISSFFDKIFYIDSFYVDIVENVNRLNWFLNKIKHLDSLYIGTYVYLDEVFYNNLPNTIIELIINNSLDINYEFILKLSKLIKFKANLDKDLFDLAFKSFLNLKYLKHFKFYFEYEIILIEKYGKYFYLNEEDKDLDFNQLIEECNKLKLELDQDE